VPTFDLAFGKERVRIDVPSDVFDGVLEGTPPPRIPLRRAFDEAWSAPIGIGDPAEILEPGERVVVVITDHTRPTPTREVFPLLWEKIRGRVAKEDVTLLVATGTHRAPTDGELEDMLGELRGEFSVLVHDCDRDAVEIGTTALGTPIAVHRALVEADRIVTIGHIGMHYYAGYSGGRKNVLPGVAGRATIEANHARLTDPRSTACVYEGNPINEEMVEAARRVGLDFIVDVVLSSAGEVAKVVVGEPETAHAVGRAFWDEHFQVPFCEPYDVVIASAGGHPKDIDLYQAYKGQYNAMKAVRDDGILYLIAACPDGIGHPVFADWIERSGSPEDVFAVYEEEGFRLGGHKAVYHAQDLRRATIYLRSEIDDETVRRFFMEPAVDVAGVLEEAARRFGGGYRVLVMPHAADTFPVCRGA
jgi:nickel-dependent lactate racemase